MLISWKQTLKESAYLAVDVFTTGERDGLQRTLLLLFTCSVSSLLLSSLLFLYLLLTLNYDLAVSGGISCGFGTLLTVALFLSKRVRCLGTLFVISIFMKKSRNLLLTAGHQFSAAKKHSQHLGEHHRFPPDWNQKSFQVTLGEAEQKLNATVKYVKSIMNTVSSVSEKMFPALSFLVLMMFIALHIKRYRSDMKYQKQEEELYTPLPSARPTTERESHAEKTCLPKPKLLLYNSIIPLAAILLLLLLMALIAAKASQIRIMVCERFFSNAAEMRVEYLYAKILRKRLKKRKEKNNSGYTPLYLKPQFWCPLLFRPKEHVQTIA
ncbi:hypothetical protein KUCAC02_013921 [Chaenocephalus aceratus]|uniref:Uncharacterized protein n=1 Tax=Chaenocephalus aceratus TaxID=36190 RepID=A0ACB9WCW9_CHAAC|nr:hypothetical protein KUCAC02_013921 [Chaenocephalus aceratus]